MQVSISFNRWASYLQEVTHQAKVVANVLSRMLCFLSRMAFARWCELIEQRRERRAAVARAVRLMKNVQLACGYRRWVDFVHERRHSRATIQRVVARRWLLGLHAAYVSALTACMYTMRVELIGHFKSCMTEIYLHI